MRTAVVIVMLLPRALAHAPAGRCDRTGGIAARAQRLAACNVFLPGSGRALLRLVFLRVTRLDGRAMQRAFGCFRLLARLGSSARGFLDLLRGGDLGSFRCRNLGGFGLAALTLAIDLCTLVAGLAGHQLRVTASLFL